VISHRETRTVAYPAALMYAVVADVEKYPQFLPWVVSLRVLSRRENGLIAEMAVGYGALRERYTSEVTLDPARQRIDVVYIQDRKKAGLFKALENHWRFMPRKDERGEEGCDVEFSIAFEFRSRLLHSVAGHAFEKVMLKMADAFEARAAELSRKPSLSL